MLGYLCCHFLIEEAFRDAIDFEGQGDPPSLWLAVPWPQAPCT